MTPRENYALMAKYNRWMNQKIYSASGTLSSRELARQRGAFFGSVLGTLNYIYVGDTLLLKRFATHPDASEILKSIQNEPMPASLDAMPFPDFEDLKTARSARDTLIIAFIEALPESSYHTSLEYTDTKGIPMKKSFGLLIQHFFNHQIHHRGQVTTLLSQQDIDPGITDLLALIPELKPEENVDG